MGAALWITHPNALNFLHIVDEEEDGLLIGSMLTTTADVLFKSCVTLIALSFAVGSFDRRGELSATYLPAP